MIYSIFEYNIKLEMVEMWLEHTCLPQQYFLVENIARTKKNFYLYLLIKYFKNVFYTIHTLCLFPLVCWLNIGEAVNLLNPHWNINFSLDFIGCGLILVCFNTTFNTDILCSFGNKLNTINGWLSKAQKVMKRSCLTFLTWIVIYQPG